MKTCNRCLVSKPQTEFYKNSKRVYPYCKECSRRSYAEPHYKLNKEDYLDSAKENCSKFLAFYRSLKGELSCTKCGEGRWWVLDFHHVDPSKKEYNISNLARKYNKDKLLREIEKCIPLCRNCHADLHHWERITGEL